MAKVKPKLSKSKAKEMLKNPPHGKPLSEKQEHYFQAIAHGWIPKAKDGIITDPKGQWKHPGKITRIPSGDITMQGVPYPVYGIDDLGNSQMMYPEQDYNFPGNSVTEYPMMQSGGSMVFKKNQIFNPKYNLNLPLLNSKKGLPFDLYRTDYPNEPESYDNQGYGVNVPFGNTGLNLYGELDTSRESGTGKLSAQPWYGLSFTKEFQSGGRFLTVDGEAHRVYRNAEGDIMVNHPKEDKGKWDTINLTDKSNANTIAEGVASVKKWHRENPYAFGGNVILEKYQDGKVVNTLEGDLYSKILMNRNRNKDFVKRAYAVGQYPGSNMFTEFADFDTKQSHKMGWGEDESGQAYMFPTIMNPANEAIPVPNIYADYISSQGYKNATGIPIEYAQGGLIKRADGSYSRRGLWDNIRANAGSGKKPTKEMLKQEKKIRAAEKKENGGAVWEIIEDTPIMQRGGRTPIEISDPREFKLKNKAYTDSLNLFLNSEKEKEALRSSGYTSLGSTPWSGGITSNPNIKPIQEEAWGKDGITSTWIDIYKKPVQPVVYKPKTLEGVPYSHTTAPERVSPRLERIEDVYSRPKQESITIPQLQSQLQESNIQPLEFNKIPYTKGSYYTVKTGSSYRNPITQEFEPKTFLIDKTTGKKLTQPEFESGGKVSTEWEIIEDSDEMSEYKHGGKTPVWQRKEGKSPSGGLNAKGRASLKREGHDIKPPQPQGGARKKSFCARMKGMKKKLTGSKKANDPNSRINLSLKKWKC